MILRVKAWLQGTWMFLKVLSSYRESVVENELTLLQAWGLCHALCQARYERSTPMSEYMTNTDREGDP